MNIYYQRLLWLCIVLGTMHISAQAQTWLSTGPYLQEVSPNGATVVFAHSLPSVSWVEVCEKGHTETMKFFQTINGQIKVHRQIIPSCPSLPTQNFAIRMHGLKPASNYSYRVVAKRINNQNANGVTTGEKYTSQWYDFSTINPQDTEHHIFITSDMHNTPDKLRNFMEMLDYQSCDFFFFNGDMTDYMQVSGNRPQEPYKGYINTCVELFAPHKAFHMVRGNHETRGDISRHYQTYFPTESGEAYNMYRYGNMAVVFLDSGEDKVDSHIEYYGTSAYYKYRENQAKWFSQIIKSEQFKTAEYRILITHFPLIQAPARNDEFDGWPHFSSLMLPTALKGQFDVVVSGHTHPQEYTFYPKNYQGRGNSFEEYTIGAHSAMRMDIEQGEIHLKIVSETGETLLEKTIKANRAGQKLFYITTDLN